MHITSGRLRDAVLAEIPAFSASGNPEILPGLDRHTAEHVQEIRRLFAGGEAGEFEFVKSHAHAGRNNGFLSKQSCTPIAAATNFVAWLREAALATGPRNPEQAVSAVADFAIEYTNIVSSIAASEYVAHTRMLAEAEGDRRTELLNILLRDMRIRWARCRILKRAGYLEQRQAYCVVVAQSTNARKWKARHARSASPAH